MLKWKHVFQSPIFSAHWKGWCAERRLNYPWDYHPLFKILPMWDRTVRIQQNSRTQSTAQLMTEMDVLSLVGHKPWQAKAEPWMRKEKVCLVCFVWDESCKTVHICVCAYV